MKSVLRPALWFLTFSILLASIAARAAAPGTVRFATWVEGEVDAQVFRLAWDLTAAGWVPVDSRFVGQIFFRRPGDSVFTSAGEAAAFSDGLEGHPGYVLEGRDVELPGLLAGEVAEVKVVAWLRGYGATYEAAKAQGLGQFGESAILRLTLGGGGAPAALLRGLRAFSVARILVSVADELGPAPSHPVQWVANGHWYWRVEAPGLGWSGARAVAESMAFHGARGHLVSISGEAENGFLAAHPGLGNNRRDVIDGFWIGAYRPAAATNILSGWQWTTGELFRYSDWYFTEPTRPPQDADYQAYLGRPFGPSGYDWSMVDSAQQATRRGYLVEFDTDPDPGAAQGRGVLQPLYVKVGIGIKTLVSWAPREGDVLERASDLVRPDWQPVPPFNFGDPGEYMERSGEASWRFFRLRRVP